MCNLKIITVYIFMTTTYIDTDVFEIKIYHECRTTFILAWI